MYACKRASGVIEKEPPIPPPPEKSSGWFIGKIRFPFLETLKSTDKECRKSSLCCGKRIRCSPNDTADGPNSNGGVVVAKLGGFPVVADSRPPKRAVADRQTWRGLIALLVACLFCISSSCLMWTTDGFHTFVANQMVIDGSKTSFDWWVNPPIHPWFKVYIWNYTNWDEYTSDPTVKLKLQEVGPFTYKEVIRREAIIFDEKGITLSYREVKDYQFTPEMSEGDPESHVLVPNLPFFGANAKFPPLVWHFAHQFLNALDLGEPLVRVKAKDFIWGYDSPLFRMSKLSPFERVPMDKVGLLTSNSPDDMVILTGASDIDRLSYFVLYNNKTALDVWPNATCNMFEGSDGSMFPPRKIRAMEPVFAYKAEACRLIKFVFQKKSFAQGVRAHRYIIDRNTFSSPRTHPENLCYCNRTDLNECAPDGLFDTSPCSYGAPTLISYPHFFLADPKTLEPFEGIHPSAEDHDMYADIHPRLGMTLMGRSRLQLNVRVMNTLPHLRRGLVLPVAWFAQDMPSYEGGFKALLIFSSYSLDAAEILLLYVLPVVAAITAFFIIRRLRRLRRGQGSSAAAPPDAIECVEIVPVKDFLPSAPPAPAPCS